jgi:hypothetical protein
MPQAHKIRTQPDMMELLNKYNPARKGWMPYVYIWLFLSEHRDLFYEQLLEFLRHNGVSPDRRLLDLIRYQQEIMISLDYDPCLGKRVAYEHNWHDHFFKNRALTQENCILHYGDTHMGCSHRYELVKGDRKRYLNAALGLAYPNSKFRHFFHQPDQTVRM